MTATKAGLVAYLGWQRMGNIGDDAIYDAVRSQLPEQPCSTCRAFHARKYRQRQQD